MDNGTRRFAALAYGLAIFCAGGATSESYWANPGTVVTDYGAADLMLGLLCIVIAIAVVTIQSLRAELDHARQTLATTRSEIIAIRRMSTAHQRQLALMRQNTRKKA